MDPPDIEEEPDESYLQDHIYDKIQFGGDDICRCPYFTATLTGLFIFRSASMATHFCHEQR